METFIVPSAAAKLLDRRGSEWITKRSGAASLNEFARRASKFFTALEGQRPSAAHTNAQRCIGEQKIASKPSSEQPSHATGRGDDKAGMLWVRFQAATTFLGANTGATARKLTVKSCSTGKIGRCYKSSAGRFPSGHFLPIVGKTHRCSACKWAGRN